MQKKKDWNQAQPILQLWTCSSSPIFATSFTRRVKFRRAGVDMLKFVIYRKVTASANLTFVAPAGNVLVLQYFLFYNGCLYMCVFVCMFYISYWNLQNVRLLLTGAALLWTVGRQSSRCSQCQCQSLYVQIKRTGVVGCRGQKKTAQDNYRCV